VQLKCQDRSFHCHKAILQARSDVFEAMFRFNDASGMKRRSRNLEVVDITDADPDALEQMVHYIYSDNCTIEDENAQYLLALAEKYNLKGLKAMCKVFLRGNICHKNVADLHDIALLYNAQKLRRFIHSFVLENWNQIEKVARKQMLRKDEELLEKSFDLV